MDATEVMAALREHGMLLQSARGPIPNVAELVAGAPIKGSWWGHAAGHEIFATLNTLSSSPDVVRLRLVQGKITLVHHRLWPALVRLADRFPPAALASLHEEHTASGAHRVTEIAFPEWVPAATRRAASKLTEEQALARLPPYLRKPGLRQPGRSAAASASMTKSR
jgi:hypothetical protein